MAFTGTPVVTPISDQLCRITGLSLADGATGTISLAVGTGQVKLPASLSWAPYARFDDPSGIVDLVESVEVDFHLVADPGATYGVSGRLWAAKANGADPSTFLVTFTNSDTNEATSAAFEIYLRFH